jgi:hypothetical protein
VVRTDDDLLGLNVLPMLMWTISPSWRDVS